MNGLLFRALDTAGRRRATVSWLTGAAAAIVVVIGAAAGGASSDATAAVADPAVAAARPATVAPGRTAIDGVVVAVRPQGFSVITRDRQVVVVRTDPRTRYRAGGTRAPREALTAGRRVVVLGRVQDNGRLRAAAVVLRGQARSTPSPPTAVAVTGDGG